MDTSVPPNNIPQIKHQPMDTSVPTAAKQPIDYDNSSEQNQLSTIDDNERIVDLGESMDEGVKNHCLFCYLLLP